MAHFTPSQLPKPTEQFDQGIQGCYTHRMGYTLKMEGVAYHKNTMANKHILNFSFCLSKQSKSEPQRNPLVFMDITIWHVVFNLHFPSILSVLLYTKNSSQHWLVVEPTAFEKFARQIGSSSPKNQGDFFQNIWVATTQNHVSFTQITCPKRPCALRWVAGYPQGAGRCSDRGRDRAKAPRRYPRSKHCGPRISDLQGWSQMSPARWFKVTFLGWLSDPFKWLSDLQLGDEKVTLNHQVQISQKFHRDFFMGKNHRESSGKPRWTWGYYI